MKALLITTLFCAAVPMSTLAADTATSKAPPAPARTAVDPAKAAAHAKEDIKRHRTIAAAHEAAAKCREAGEDEDYCMAELGKACKGIAYGKYCGMKDAD